jgi:hypothetical protein
VFDLAKGADGRTGHAQGNEGCHRGDCREHPGVARLIKPWLNASLEHPAVAFFAQSIASRGAMRATDTTRQKNSPSRTTGQATQTHAGKRISTFRNERHYPIALFRASTPGSIATLFRLFG